MFGLLVREGCYLRRAVFAARIGLTTFEFSGSYGGQPPRSHAIRMSGKRRSRSSLLRTFARLANCRHS
jgi:hypothetical protein